MAENSSALLLQLPHSLRANVERISAQEGTTVNQFIALAVAEKLATLHTADYFAERAARADPTTFDRVMNRTGGQVPRPGDEMP